MKKDKRRLGLILMLSISMALSTGCGNKADTEKGETDSAQAANPRPLTYQFVSEERVAKFEDVKNADDWHAQYPHVVDSFRRGGEASQEDIEKFGVFAQNGHSTIEQTFIAAYPETPESFSAACLACHSSGYEWAYEEFGDDVMNVKWTDIKDQHAGMDFWSCYQCHGNKVDGTLTTNSFYSARITDDIDKFAPGEAVCAQCHTVFTGLEALTSDLEGVYDVHKNGYDLDGIYDALVASTNKNPNQSNDALGDAVIFDEETGIKTYGTGSYLDVEMHQGSVHQKMGLSCVDCHMPVETAEDGTVYRSHNASGSVFESQAAMDMCMACHTNDEIKTTDDLVAYTKSLQDAASERYFQIREIQKGLREAILAAMEAGKDEDLIQAARNAYSRGDYYLAYSKKVEADYVQGPVPGTTSIHNYDQVMEYYDKAEAMFKLHTEALK